MVAEKEIRGAQGANNHTGKPLSPPPVLRNDLDVVVLEQLHVVIIPVVDPVQELLAIEEIKKTKARYFRYIDTKQWEPLRGLFAPECVIRFETGLPGVDAVRIWNSGDEFVDVVTVRQADTIAVHQAFTPEITLTSERTATAIWAMHDMVIRREGADAPSFEGFGHYTDEYVLVDGQWKIASMHLTRLHEKELDHYTSS